MESYPVQSDTIQIDVPGTAIATASWGYSLNNSCDMADTYGMSFDSITATGATVTFTENTETNNGKWICVSVDDGGIVYYISSNPLLIDVTPPVVTLV